MKYFYSIIVLLMCSIFEVKTQTVAVLNSLAGTEWVKSDPHWDEYYRITNTDIIRVFIKSGELIVRHHPFYLSDDPVEYRLSTEDERVPVFISENCGKILKGKYIIWSIPDWNMANCHVFTSMTQDSMYWYLEPTFETHNGMKIQMTNGVYFQFKGVGKAKLSKEICDWVNNMQRNYNVVVTDYLYNRYMHLNGPSSGYDMWFYTKAGKEDLDILEPKPKENVLANGQGIKLSTIFAKEPVTLMYQRAKTLGIANAPCSELLGKKDAQINSCYSGICTMASSMLNMSATEAAAYAQKLYDAYVDFVNDRVTPEDLTTLCGGCTMPRYSTGN